MLNTRFCHILTGGLFVAAATFPVSTATAATRDWAIEVTASTQRAPEPSIELNWLPIANGDTFSVSRKEKNATSWTTLTNLAPGTFSFTDSNVEPGQSYEYRVALNPIPSRGGTGYILAGIDAELIDQRGKMILLLDDTHVTALQSELTLLEQDLVGDGWEVTRLEVGRSEKPVDIKAKIQTIYSQDPTNTRALFIFGHVPVPYSGNYTADGHSDHRGAWPADVYYADMDGEWTDSTVDTTSAARPENHNVPGDGKFDQSTTPSESELEVGRVDLAKMGSYDGKPEVEFLRGYLNKLHKFRHGITSLPRRAFISDNFGEMNGEAFAASGYRNFAPLFGSDKITSGAGNTYFETLKSDGYLFSYACGGGAYNFCNFVGGTGDFRWYDYKSAFTLLLGSYFGDWDAENAFLRGAIASPTFGLAAVWSGRPHWFMQHMALGETIGYTTRLNQSNGRTRTYHPSQNAGGVHIALMGDPTLRAHTVLPASEPRAIEVRGDVQLLWTASADKDIVGYHIYRSSSEKGPFVRVSSEPVKGTAYIDSEKSGEIFYQIRAIKLESSASGTYFNQSQGVFVTSVGISTNQNPEKVKLSIRPESNNKVAVSWQSEIGKTYRLLESSEFQEWRKVREVTALLFETTVEVPTIGDLNFFKVEVVSLLEPPVIDPPVEEEPVEEPPVLEQPVPELIITGENIPPQS